MTKKAAPRCAKACAIRSRRTLPPATSRAPLHSKRPSSPEGIRAQIAAEEEKKKTEGHCACLCTDQNQRGLFGAIRGVELADAVSREQGPGNNAAFSIASKSEGPSGAFFRHPCRNRQQLAACDVQLPCSRRPRLARSPRLSLYSTPRRTTPAPPSPPKIQDRRAE